MGKKENTLPSQWELKVETTKPPKARENAGDQVGFSLQLIGYESGADFSGPITE